MVLGESSSDADPAEDRARLAALMTRAENILRDRVWPGVQLSKPEIVDRRDRSLIVRCAAHGWVTADSVIVKLNKGDDQRGFTDWASLVFLSALPAAEGIAPGFYAGDARERIIVMEDLGGSSTLADLLDGRCGPTTERLLMRMLCAMAVPMAQLIAGTLDRESSFEEIRGRLPGAARLGRVREAEHWLRGRERLEQWCRELGCRPPSGFDAALSYLAERYAAPGLYLAFSHGDPAPSNTHLRRERVRLMDFEYAAFRHALYDITGWYVLCPLPAPWIHKLESAFRRALAVSSAASMVRNKGRYQLEWATMCAFRALAMLTWLPGDVLERERVWMPGWTARQAAISTAFRLRDATAGVAPLGPIAEFGGGVAAALQMRWPELGDGAPRWQGIAAARHEE